jgi:YHS domain-containing protein
MIEAMRKVTVALFVAFVLAGAIAVSASSDDAPAKKNVTNKVCPVSGGPVQEKYRTEYKGQYVYVCCEGCLNEFNKSPDTFVAKMSKEEKEAIQINQTCPVSGEPISKNISVEYEGRKVYFCCEHCQEKFKKDHPAAK